MKTITFLPNGEQRTEPTLSEINEAIERLNQRLTSFAEGQKRMEEEKERAFNWDRIDQMTDEETDAEALQELNEK